jgi:hypothetical protein
LEERLTKSNPGVIRADPESTFFIDYLAVKSFRILTAAIYSSNILIEIENWSTGILTKFQTDGSSKSASFQYSGKVFAPVNVITNT